MSYISTRDARTAPERLSFEDVLLAGLAPDGGLYVPAEWPALSPADLRAMRGVPYAEIAFRVISPFIGASIPTNALKRMIDTAYRGFDHRAVAPLKQLGPELWLLELFHGPTLAFKDYALQLVGPLFEHVLEERGEHVTVIGATSGDTGSAAIAACRHRPAIDVFILYPEGRISEVQRRQMTTVNAPNVHAIAVEGSFDDCQDLVKAMFADAPFRAAFNLSAVNSINWARIMAQIVYYVAAGVALGAPDRAVSFSVPTGNFGNVYAAHVARRLGLPIAELVLATNRNDILARFINDGAMAIRSVEPSLSPSMDIQVSSNFERLLFELKERDGKAVAAAMAEFRATGTLPASEADYRQAQALFEARRIDDAATRQSIAETFRETGELLDPHSAIAVAAARQARRETSAPMVALATAHPAKFPEAVEDATGRRPALPPRLADLLRRPERRPKLGRHLRAIEDYVRAYARPKRKGGAA
ncbi:MAG TPA: threonine synthase [Stellaceae bacterium]|nr:threonine synthase [Stellaceae bacterium]